MKLARSDPDSGILRAPKRAVTLLIVLLSIVGITSALVMLAQEASTTTRASAAAIDARIADDLLRASEVPVLHWLEMASPYVVLLPEAAVPTVRVLDDPLRLGDHHARVTIDATDVCGPSRINVSTASLALVESTLANLGLGGIDGIREARALGRLPLAPRVPAVMSDELPIEQRVSFVNASPRWEMRIRLKVGQVTRTWRSTYVHAGEHWTLQAREVIHD
jgi:hypothetical protein